MAVEGFGLVKQFCVSMTSDEYYPFGYDGLLRRRSRREFSWRSLLVYFASQVINRVGNPFGLGEWVVGYFSPRAE